MSDKSADVLPPVIRRRLKSIEKWREAKTCYSPSLARWGFSSQVQLEKGERMRAKLAACFAGVKSKLAQEVPGIIFNPPEVFPVNQKQCVVLITGWKPETILVS